MGGKLIALVATVNGLVRLERYGEVVAPQGADARRYAWWS
jgi:hypothetical protein